MYTHEKFSFYKEEVARRFSEPKAREQEWTVRNDF
jgi:hypothetical protein